MSRAGRALHGSMLVVVLAALSAVIVVLTIHLVARSGTVRDGSNREDSSRGHLVDMRPDEVPEAQRGAYIEAKLVQFKSLPKDQRAERIWELWKTIGYDDTQWSDWIDYEDRLFGALSDTGEAGITILFEQFHADSALLAFDACAHLGDFGLEAMHRVLSILENGTESDKSLALTTLRDSFAFEDLPDEERLRMRSAVEAVATDESEAIRDQAEEILRILDWCEQQLEPHSPKSE